MKTVIAAFCFAVFTGCVHAQTGIPTSDVTTNAQLIRQFAVLESQFQQAVRSYQSITGNRGIGALANNPTIRRFMPSDLRAVFDAADRVRYGYGLNSIADEVERAEKYMGTNAELRTKIDKRKNDIAVMGKASSILSYQGVGERAKELDILAAQINETQDQKAAAELQSRLTVLQSNLIIEQHKSMLMAQAYQAENDLVESQRRELDARTFRASNRGMPEIKMPVYPGR